jgi:hypothetical protein
MSALLLGLLVSSAKTSYDTTRAEVMQVASNYRFLDRLLEIYGPHGEEMKMTRPISGRCLKMSASE